MCRNALFRDRQSEDRKELSEEKEKSAGMYGSYISG
jgi:hypothetical protein